MVHVSFKAIGLTFLLSLPLIDASPAKAAGGSKYKRNWFGTALYGYEYVGDVLFLSSTSLLSIDIAWLSLFLSFLPSS